jgi:hypothetical protein
MKLYTAFYRNIKHKLIFMCVHVVVCTTFVVILYIAHFVFKINPRIGSVRHKHEVSCE